MKTSEDIKKIERASHLLPDPGGEVVRDLCQEIRNLHDGATVTCVYCAHQFKEGSQLANAKHLYEHTKVCDKHPLSRARKVIHELLEAMDNANGVATISQTVKEYDAGLLEPLVITNAKRYLEDLPPLECPEV